MTPLRAAALITATTLALAACSSSESGPKDAGASPGGTTIRVAAAASLTKPFTEIGKDFEAANPGTTVQFTFAGSSDLAAQIEAGAPVDVFASADEANMTKAAQYILGHPTRFATNTLTIVTAPGNPKEIGSLADLARSDLDVVVCAPQVPCGSATKKVTDLAQVTLTPRSEESKVTDVLAKVREGEADAGLVYVTDAKGAGDAVTSVSFPEATKAVNVYPIAVIQDTHEAELAEKFRDYVAKGDGQEVLRDAGFKAP
ncbi:molybdate ABC transporter substrate-binding protein [Janibacter sp. GXQ6167]|uniref:molybdate ABC transporter substrate-binding protein n=1 Tax=Janibacter sp. GXQ6167 TaxID=3240791 RepID=UPI0035252330